MFLPKVAVLFNSECRREMYFTSVWEKRLTSLEKILDNNKESNNLFMQIEKLESESEGLKTQLEANILLN